MAEVAISNTPSTDALDKTNDMVALFRKDTTQNPRSKVLVDIIKGEFPDGVIAGAAIAESGTVTITRTVGSSFTFSINAVVNALIAAANISDSQIAASIARDSEVAATYAPLAGATFTGPVRGPAPAQNNDLVTKQYVDALPHLTTAQVNALIAAATIADSQIASTIARDAEVSATYAALAGATFTGAVSGITPTANAHFVTKQYVDGLSHLTSADVNALIAAASIADSQIAESIARDAEVANTYAALAGATFTGSVSGIAPTANAHFTTKAYVDAAVAAGGVMAPTDKIYFGLSADAIPVPAEATITATNGSASIGAFTDMRILIYRAAAQPDIVSVLFSDDDSDTNQLGAFTKYNSTVIPTSETAPFNVWVSNQLLTQAVAATMSVR